VNDRAATCAFIGRMHSRKDCVLRASVLTGARFGVCVAAGIWLMFARAFVE
jgi:hypothetical protein